MEEKKYLDYEGLQTYHTNLCSIIEDNEQVTAAALDNLDDRLKDIETENPYSKQEIDDLLEPITDKLDNIEEFAEVNVQSNWNQTDSSADDYIKNKPTSMPASDVSAWAKASSKPTYTASEVGAIPTSAKGVASGVATLDSTGKVPSSQLPSYVDDVLEYDTKSAFPTTGEGGKIYVDKSNNTTWRWSGSSYTQIKGDLTIGTTSGTAADGKVVNDHINNTSNPHGVTKAQVGLGSVVNTGDSATPVSGGTTKFTTGGAYTELAKKVDKVSGKGLSTNDYTTDEKNKLAGIAAGAEVNVQSDWNATSGDAMILNKPTIPAAVTESTVSGWGFTKNAGTITGIKMNGASKGTSGVVDLGTVITAHQDISGKVDDTTTVNGHALSGNVTVTKSDVGLGNVGNFKAVSTVASQGLSDTEKSNARANIDAEDVNNKVTSISSSSTDIEYPSAKCVYEEISNLHDSLLDDMEELADMSYGIRWTSANATPYRVGNRILHKNLPIQKMMRRCMLQDDGTVYGYIDPNDYTKYTNGTIVDYTCAHGQYMVEIPEYWYTGPSEDGTYGIDLYPQKVSGALHSPKCYISAVEATSNDTSSDTPKKLFSICDATIPYNEDGSVSANAVITYSTDAADHRGGNRNTTYDGIKTLLGRPATNLTRDGFRTRAAARGTGWSQQYWKAYMAWVRLFVVEYCTFNSQADYNAIKTTEGYMQGGLGAGVSTVNSTAWNNFNAYNPFVPCGVTKRLGNSTGVVTYKFAAGEFTTTAVEVSVPSYRGIENPFGHIWKWTDGVNVYCDGETHKSTIYTCDDITKFADNTSTNYVLRTADCYQGTEGWIKNWLIDGNADFLPLTNGGSASSYLYNYSWFNNTGWRVLCSSGSALRGTKCGLFDFDASTDSSYARAHIGGRLYYTPSE